MDEVVKNISKERLEYYKEHIDECPIDILRVLYAESEADLYAANMLVSDQLDIIRDLERQIRIKDGYCDLIWSLGVDYDGCNTIGSLKSLIDELVDYAKKACRNDDKYAIGENLAGKYYNILYEEVEKPKED